MQKADTSADGRVSKPEFMAFTFADVETADGEILDYSLLQDLQSSVALLGQAGRMVSSLFDLLDADSSVRHTFTCHTHAAHTRRRAIGSICVPRPCLASCDGGHAPDSARHAGAAGRQGGRTAHVLRMFFRHRGSWRSARARPFS